MRLDFQRPYTPPPGAREVLLVRHGAVDPPGPGGLIDGRSDPGLNAAGRAQAQEVLAALGEVPAAAVICTQLRRAQETAAPLAERLGLVAVADPRLGEVFLGEWEGHGIHWRSSEAHPEFLEMVRAQAWERIPGAEPAVEFAARVAAGLEGAADAAGEGRPAIVITHGAVIAEACRRVTGSTPFAFLRAANGGVTRLVRGAEGEWILLAFNETAHLRVR